MRVQPAVGRRAQRDELSVANQPTEVGDANLMNALLREFLTRAWLSATAMNFCQAMRDGRIVKLGGAIQTILPPTALIFPAVATGAIQSPISSGIVLRLDKFYTSATVARRVTELHCDNPNALRVPMNCDWPSLCQMWLGVCQAIGLVARTVEALDIDPAIVKQVRQLTERLDLIAAGLSPCVAEDGFVVAPGVLDRRSEARVPVQQRIWIESNAGRQSVLLRDISMNGLGISLSSGVKKGMLVAAELPGGRRLKGIVVWAKNGGIGVRLVHPLNPSDPLLTPMPQPAASKRELPL